MNLEICYYTFISLAQIIPDILDLPLKSCSLRNKIVVSATEKQFDFLPLWEKIQDMLM